MSRKITTAVKREKEIDGLGQHFLRKVWSRVELESSQSHTKIDNVTTKWFSRNHNFREIITFPKSCWDEKFLSQIFAKNENDCFSKFFSNHAFLGCLFFRVF